MLKLAVAITLCMAFIIPVSGDAMQIERFVRTERLVSTMSENQSNEKALSSVSKELLERQLNSLNAEVTFLEMQTKLDYEKLWKRLQRRDQLLKMYLREKHIVGKSRAQVIEILGTPLNTIKLDGSLMDCELFSISDGMKSKPVRLRTSIYLEVVFSGDTANSERIVIKRKKISDRFRDLSASLDELNNQPEFFRKEYVEELLQSEVEAAANAEKITPDAVGQTCYINFKVANDGNVNDIRITRGSLSPAFDSLVVNTLRRMSGKKFLKCQNAENQPAIEFNIGFGLLDRDPRTGESLELLQNVH